MDLKEFKKIALFAKRVGIQKLKCGDTEIDFGSTGIHQPIEKPEPLKVEAEIPLPSVPDSPTLDQINKFIYGATDEDTE